MKPILLFILFLSGVTHAHAQIPVVDVASLTEAVASLAELRNQVRLLLKEVSLSTQIQKNTQSHLSRYERALSKRGLIPSEPLGNVLDMIKQERQEAGGMVSDDPNRLRKAFPMYVDMPDPLRFHQHQLETTMSTLEGILRTSDVHQSSVHRAHGEIDHFKGEIVRATEPQQMRDVHANLQILHARELLLTRQALTTLIHLETIQAADEVSQNAQEQMRYQSFVGDDQWVGHSTHYTVKRFLRMPGAQ